jgi:hypothetical protein
METINGRIKKVVGRGSFKALDMGGVTINRCARYLCLALFSLSIAGCSLPKLKSSLITGAATSAVVGVTSVLPGGVIVPTVASGLTAATASALTAEKSVKGEPISVTADTVVNKAPDNFWTLLGRLISMGGWALILIVIVPMLFSWLLPGPIQFKGKKKK